MNLNEIHVPENADDALEWAARREFGLRYDSYRECQVRENGLREMFLCTSPEEQWIHSLRAELLESG